ncbi:MAG TPA: glycoside hydrolase family 31 protein [Flavobacteriaceae bacterium]|nr:glycoside hydrolase family 31 protein [Flavobacteriaceae bacterium]MCB9212567.1 glycoside hydrolase family 31 protein [Alteromonas sp.]HPF10635.1 glycoside hydrolase family 31 protein [Flavobacteriaceae bacterium]HQU20917.1 glycoside hydrolase family 31 protein [Flavobacteriaceae bacterium]HQU64401.1 glycoside hydrolase family 31 protein [Flavobacteriaceae bacterium]
MIVNTELEHKGNQFPSLITNFIKEKDKFLITSENGVQLQITVIRDSVLRFRYNTEGAFPKDFSYAIDTDAVRGYNHLEYSEESDHFKITTAKLVLHIDKANMRKHIYDMEGNLINEDEIGFHWEYSYEHGSDIVKMSKMEQKLECYYGLGDKPTHFNLKGKRFQNWVTDEYAFGKDRDPLYKAIPFYIGLHTNVSYGIFFDNTFRTFFDFGQERRNVTSFWAQGGEMNYYFFYGPEMTEVVTSYTDLTGKPELPPLWALGYHQSKWSYFPESNVREVTQKFRDLKIPCDAIYLDIDYMEGWRCFTWNNDYFPDPKKMVSDLEAQGFKTVAIIDPGIKIDKDYWVYQEALENDYFCKRADGPLMRGKVWPGECNFPDFTNPKVRKWWSGLYKELIEDIGIKGVWNDMNEPAVMEVPTKTFPLDVRHDYDGNPCSHSKAHNIYGMQMAKATYKGLKQFVFPKRPFVITRAAYSGTQRYTSSWTGDNVASWEHLWIANQQIQRMSISGMSFIGTDIGGFAEQPTGELFVRWIQLGIFHPFCRVHSSGDHGDQEPWSFDENVTDIVRKFIELRYKLLPYLYTTFRQYVTDGTPMIQPLVLFDQQDSQTYYRTDEFLLGNHLLICPILEPNARGRRMYIPRGRWYNYWTHEVIEGGKEQWVDADIDSIPLFVKEGGIIPKYPVQQYVGEKEFDEVELEVYFKEGKEESFLYEDAHDGYDYRKGRYSFRTFKLTGKPKELIIQQHKEGKHTTPYTKFKMDLKRLPFTIKTIEVDNQVTPLSQLKVNGNTTLVIDKNFTELHIIGK